MDKRDFDAVVVGSGPNGLAAAITMQQQGLSVLLIEGKENIGGGLRTAELTLPSFLHDVCSAIHPTAIASPYLKTLPLQQHGLEFINPEVAAAHPFDDGTAATLYQSLEATAQSFGIDEQAYLKLLRPILKNWDGLIKDVMAPLHIPANPFAMAGFGLKALLPAVTLANNTFKTTQTRGLWAGMAAHSIQPLTNISTSAIGLVLMAAGHKMGWPIPKGGSKAIAQALASYFTSLGGKIQTNFMVSALSQLPSCHAVLFDLTPQQILKIAGHQFSLMYKRQLQKYRHGMGVCKVDWALDGPIPFTNSACRAAGTVHLGNTLEEIVASEQQTVDGKHPEKPFVLLAQQSLFDATRAPAGKHTVWAYCHVPNNSPVDMSTAIEQQIERFAPGFRDLILDKHVLNAQQMENYNPNYIGGDINGGVADITQLFTRPALKLSPYRTSKKGLYICSSSTPPGGGVHGMCGYHAARRALQDIFNINLKMVN